jgi:N-terminal domain of anti-restriction factor ArdC/IrrE N-terminal-like domain
MTAPSSNPAAFADLLARAVSEPGVISDAYRRFHQYSIGNQLLAWSQCLERGIPPGPMATFPRWKELGRYVRKGEKAITLCQPVTVKRPADSADPDADQTNGPGVFTRFVYRPHWFVLAQTDGAEMPPAPIPTWDASRALAALDVAEIPFDAMDGNCLGYARGRSIAINPVNPMPHKTRFHELAHVLLEHTAEGVQADGEITPRNLRECEAEAVALLCCAALDLPGVEHCRGYLQAWWGAGNPIPERSAQRVLKAADQILRAGRDAGAADREGA